MELKLTRTDTDRFVPVQDNVCGREETLEMIVPDACPDIAQVVDTCGCCCLTRREITDSGAVLAGAVRVTVLYTPEGGDGLRRLETELPFQHLHECQNTDSGCRLLAKAWVASAETRIINPRKILIRVDLRERIQIFAPKGFVAYSGLEAGEELGVQQRIEHYQTAFVVQPMEKTFALEEEIALNTGRNGPGTILRILPAARCTEARLIGSKLVMKGTVGLQLLCQSENGELYTTETDLPLSQMLDAGGAGPEADFQVELQVLSWQLGQVSEDGRTVSISMELAAQAVFCENFSVSLVTDAYSLYYPLTLQTEPLGLQQITELTARQAMRVSIETEPNIRTVCSCRVELGTAQISREGENATIQVAAEASVLFLREDGSYDSVRQKFSVDLQQTLAAGSGISVQCAVEQAEALPSASGVELRGTVEVQIQICQPYQVNGLCGADLDREHPFDHAGQPSIVLRRPTAGEQMWDIAKRYATTCQEICGANGLSEEQTLDSRMLLIPRKR